MIHQFRDNIIVEDGLLDDQLRNNISGFITEKFLDKQEFYLSLDPSECPYYDAVKFRIDACVYAYCEDIGIDADRLQMDNFQVANFRAYNQTNWQNPFWEPHEDIAENYFLACILYIRSEYTEQNWAGGELSIYKNFTALDWPHNAVHIRPFSNRLVMFPGYLVHKIRPYFGTTDRQSMVFGYSIQEQWQDQIQVL
jgi:hypothetical protein